MIFTQQEKFPKIMEILLKLHNLNVYIMYLV
jgi:hypothetical protein